MGLATVSRLGSAAAGFLSPKAATERARRPTDEHTKRMDLDLMTARSLSTKDTPGTTLMVGMLSDSRQALHYPNWTQADGQLGTSFRMMPSSEGFVGATVHRWRLLC